MTSEHETVCGEAFRRIDQEEHTIDIDSGAPPRRRIEWPRSDDVMRKIVVVDAVFLASIVMPRRDRAHSVHARSATRSLARKAALLQHRIDQRRLAVIEVLRIDASSASDARPLAEFPTKASPTDSFLGVVSVVGSQQSQS